MKRVIKSYEKMDASLQALLQKTYPEGFNTGNILTFQDHTGKRFKGVELVVDDTIFLIKLDEMLRSAFSDVDEKEEGEEDYDREDGPESDEESDNFEDSFDGIDD